MCPATTSGTEGRSTPRGANSRASAGTTPVVLLDPGVVEVDDVRFVGATLWTDSSSYPAPHAEAWAHHEVGALMPDF